MNTLVRLTVNKDDAFINLTQITHAVHVDGKFYIHFAGGAPLVISDYTEKSAAEAILKKHSN